jgi:signal peptidase II
MKLPAETSLRSPWVIPGSIAATVIVADQITKFWVVNTLGPEPRTREMVILEDWLSLRYIRNTGVAFGLFQNFPQLFTVTSILITLAAIYAYRYHLPWRSAWVQASMGLIVGGALGNIIDRLRLGYVIDFVRVGWWPIFNVADSAVTSGVVMLAMHLLIFGEEPAPAPLPRDDGLLDELLSREPER